MIVSQVYRRLQKSKSRFAGSYGQGPNESATFSTTATDFFTDAKMLAVGFKGHFVLLKATSNKLKGTCAIKIINYKREREQQEN